MKIENFTLKIIISSFVYSFICLFVYSPNAFAQSPTPGTISVSPSIIQIDLATDAPQAEITYTNNTQSTVELQLSASDFTELENGYKLSFLQGNDAKNYRYALSSWITFDQTDITLSPRESKIVKVFIEKDHLTTGGHYGAILAEWVQKEHEGNVHVKAILSSLLFVRTAHGNEREEASIDLFTPLQKFFFFPDEYVIKFKNSGNVELTPHGLIELNDFRGVTVAHGIFNDGSLITLPESIRRYTTPLTLDKTILLPGFYHANLWVHYGKKEQQIHLSTTLFTFGTLSFLPVFLITMLILIFVIRYIKMRKKF